MTRTDGRKTNELRKIKVVKNYIKHPAGSCLIEAGETRVICTATVEESVPPFLKGTGKGWVTAEYGMLPGSCTNRIKRNDVSGRVQEIQRLVGRSLRAVVDMANIGERTIKIDCDVIQADGGTRTASITGGFIALILALEKMKKEGHIKKIPVSDYVTAVSVGIVDGELLLDLKYDEDSKAQMDMNVVMVGQGEFVEVQGTAEGKPFSKKQMDGLLKLAEKGIGELLKIQKQTLKGIEI
ncbi:MAG: ribonuclease PH [Candidatus Omnitrophica bacterium]|nr:ribonuclease PH [Candidatus Omnitrophota bacterium]